MDREPGPKRVLLKLSGNAFMGAGGETFDSDAVAFISSEIARTAASGVRLAVVCGAGNVIRGAGFCPEGPGRVRADFAGMLATLVNVLVLRDGLEQQGVSCAHYSAFGVVRVAEAFEPLRAREDLEKGRVVLLAGGTGNPFFTTDTAAALRAVELGAGLLLKATRVDGVYSDDPEKNPAAKHYARISYQEVLERKLGVMDLTAISFCMEHGLQVRVFNYAVEGNIQRAAAGEELGTLIGESEDAG
jgi:uridylate kinase